MLKLVSKSVLYAALIVSPVCAEMRQYFLGTFQLAGMVPAKLPALGSRLSCQHTEQSLLDRSQVPAGFIPARFRGPIQGMLDRGLPLQFEVVALSPAPQPGYFLTVELWVITDRPEDLQPLIYALPVEVPATLLAADE